MDRTKIERLKIALRGMDLEGLSEPKRNAFLAGLTKGGVSADELKTAQQELIDEDKEKLRSAFKVEKDKLWATFQERIRSAQNVEALVMETQVFLIEQVALVKAMLKTGMVPK